jgi:quercetin dioxygenase-like cupin family protein
MTKPAIADAIGEVRIIGPDEGADFWQPVPANGHISVRVAPGLVPMEHPVGLGTQTVPPGCYVREHSHPRNEEVIHFISGKGQAVVDGVEYEAVPGMTIFIGKGRRHMFINSGTVDMHWLWLMVPNGLESFFEQIGRPRKPGEPAPAPFARPDNVLEIERNTVFAPPPADQRQP